MDVSLRASGPGGNRLPSVAAWALHLRPRVRRVHGYDAAARRRPMAQTTIPDATRGRGGADRRPGGGALRRPGDERSCCEQLAGADLDGRSVCVLVPDGTRSCPLPLLLAAVHGALHGRVSRLTVLVALGTHAADGRGRAGPAPRLPGRRLRRALSRHRRCSTTSGGTRRRSSRSARSAPTGSPSCPSGRLAPVGRGAAQPRRRRARRRAGGRAGVPARGGRLLRRQQVLLPRRLRPGGHQRLALAGCADHQRRRSSAPAGSPRCGR